MEDFHFSLASTAGPTLEKMQAIIGSPDLQHLGITAFMTLDMVTDTLRQGGTVTMRDQEGETDLTLERLRDFAHQGAVTKLLREVAQEDAARSAVPLWLAKFCQRISDWLS